jgi:hypothetical protein
MTFRGAPSIFGGGRIGAGKKYHAISAAAMFAMPPMVPPRERRATSQILAMPPSDIARAHDIVLFAIARALFLAAIA